MKYQVDKLLYQMLPPTVHRWGAENRARVRSLGLAVALVAGPWLAETLTEEHYQLVVGLGGALLAALTGEATHRVVTPWEEGEDV